MSGTEWVALWVIELQRREAEAKAKAAEAEAKTKIVREALQPKCCLYEREPVYITSASNITYVPTFYPKPEPKPKGYEVEIDGGYWRVRLDGRFIGSNTERTSKAALKEARKRIAEHAKKQPPTTVTIREA